MARATTTYVCQSCGAATNKWAGKCDACGEWNTLAEEPVSAPVGAAGGRRSPRGRAARLVDLAGRESPPARILTGYGELDRVAGGGFVAGSAVLIGGDPGIGKSTLLLQAVARLAQAGNKVVYVTGEEAVSQVRLRAMRLGVETTPVKLLAETHVPDIIATLSALGEGAVVVIDSVQTLWSAHIEAAPGTVSQLRAGAEALVRFAKTSGACVILVGHVTKDGQIAGPKVIEHMVDAVLYFDGEGANQFRIVRAVKNRFGPTDEIGVFEMTDQGLREVANPSRLLMGARQTDTAGSAVLAGIEGTRALLVEVQALVTPSPLATPRRAVVGWDANRLAMVLAVLEAHAGVAISGHDVYLSVAGGLRVREPAADVAVAAALVSSLTGKALPRAAAMFGEIALSGALRPVGSAEQRIKEAGKLGMDQVVSGPLAGVGEAGGITHRQLADVAGLAAWVAALA